MLIKLLCALFSIPAFLAASPIYSFTLFRVPDAEITTALGNNDKGQVVGSFRQSFLDEQTGFIRNADGSFVIVDFPGAGSVVLSGINNQGDAAGFLVSSSGEIRGFVRRPDGSFLFQNVPTSTDSQSLGLNDAGTVVGGAGFASGEDRERVATAFRTDGSVFLNRMFAGASDQLMADINGSGRTVGTAVLADGDPFGFTANVDGSDVVQFVAPGASETFATGINNQGQVAGAGLFSAGARAFVREADGRLNFVDVPGTLAAQAWGINNRSDISGFAVDEDFAQVGFIGRYIRDENGGNMTETPEPVSAVLGFSGVAGMVILRRIRSKRGGVTSSSL